MLEQLRSQTKIILWIVVVGFVGFMFFDWGMNRVRPGSEHLGLAGKVGQYRITDEEFRQEYRNQYSAYTEQNEASPTAQTEQEISNRTWETLVQRHLLWDEAAKQRLLPTDDEVLLEIQNNPPPFVRSQPVFQTDSVFDQSKYIAALSDPNMDPQFLAFLENYVRQNLPYQTLMDYMGSSVRVTDDEADTFIHVLKDEVKVTYLKVDPLSDVKESIPEPSEEQIADYFTARSEDFRVPEKRSLVYVEAPKEPSVEDRTYAREKIEDAEALVEAGEPFDEIAKNYSDDAATASKGGVIGWVKPTQLPAPVDSAVGMLKVGEVTGVIETKRGYQLIRLDDKRTTDGAEEWSLSYILSNLQASPATVENIRQDLLELAEQARGDGLDKAAQERGLEPKISEELVASQIPPLFGLSQEDVDRIFRAREGAVLDPLEGSDNIYVMMIAEVVPSRIPALADIKDLVKQAYVQNVRKDRARQLAEQAVAELKQGRTLEQVASATGLAAQQTPAFTRMSFVPEIGAGSVIAANAFALDEGETSGVLEYSGRFYIIRVDEKIPLNKDDLEKTMSSLRMSLIRSKQQAYLSAWYNDLKQGIRIEDYRTLASY